MNEAKKKNKVGNSNSTKFVTLIYKELTRMSTMKNFHKQLNTPARSKDSYTAALAALTKVGRSHLSALASNLEWQDWGGSETLEPSKA